MTSRWDAVAMIGMRTALRNGLAFGLLLLLGGCAQGVNARDRGFFGGLGAMITGEDERHLQRLQQRAAAREAEARMAERRRQLAEAEAARSTAELRAAEQRLAALQAELARQRAEIASLRAGTQSGSSRAATADRLAAEAEALERERRAAAGRAGGADAGALQRLEERSRRLDEDIRRFGAI